jgi:hypothetical protein
MSTLLSSTDGGFSLEHATAARVLSARGRMARLDMVL